MYINAKSNHSDTTIKELPKMINKRLSELSCNQEEFDKAKPSYEEALSESNYKASLKFEKPQYNTKRYRLRKVIWFHPPFSQNVKTNIGKTFLKLVKQHFPKHHKLIEIINKNTLKLSYWCMKNMSNIIKQHSVKILSAEFNEKRSCIAEIKNAVPSNDIAYGNICYMKLKFQQKIILNYIMVHAKENLNVLFITKQNHFGIEVMKRSFHSTFGNWRANPKITTYVEKCLCMHRSINVVQDFVIYAFNPWL